MITAAISSKLAADTTLKNMLTTYKNLPAIFTVDPAPGDAVLPFIVIGPILDQTAFDTKLTRRRTARCDVRCYTGATGTSKLVDQIAERVRYLLHRRSLSITGYVWEWSICFGPVHADETDAYGRIVTVSVTAEET